MARKPKIPPSTEAAAASPVPEPTAAPVRRGRGPKAAAPSPASLAAATIGAPTTDGVEADVTKAGPTNTPGRRGPGRKPKQQAGAEAAALPQGTAVEQAGTEADLSAAGLEQGLVENGAPVAARIVPHDDAGTDDAADGTISAARAVSGAVSSATGPKATARAAPAAQWDWATDAVRFDWPEIERLAAHDGPNQAMAKLLVAARAEGASSRWPL